MALSLWTKRSVDANARNVYLLRASPHFASPVFRPSVLPFTASSVRHIFPSSYARVYVLDAPPSAPPITFAFGFARRAKGNDTHDEASRVHACVRICVRAGVRTCVPARALLRRSIASLLFSSFFLFKKNVFFFTVANQ